MPARLDRIVKFADPPLRRARVLEDTSPPVIFQPHSTRHKLLVTKEELEQQKVEGGDAGGASFLEDGTTRGLTWSTNGICAGDGESR